MHHSAVHQTIATVWRLESARIVATVARRVRDLALAEELAQDALIAALEHWPREGLPANTAAWLMTTAQHRALDHLRHVQMAQARHEDIAADRAARGDDRVPDIAEALDQTREGLADDVLRLMFVACHPLLSPEARVALTLRLVGGLSTQEIARAHLVPEATVAQRIVRAQRTLNRTRVPEIASYILKNPEDYAFSALTASIDADVAFEPLGADPNASRVGLLHVPMDAKFIINDGQHRRAVVAVGLGGLDGL
jgi:RNA polymerase sigma factor (sigma-70 family)